ITPDNLNILLGRGDGTFQAGTQVSTGSSTYAVVQGDFNEDGRLDLATANHTTKDVAILLGQQDGTFRLHGRFSVGADTVGLTPGDFNGDGHVDLALANFNAPNILVLFGRGDGTFGDLAAVAVPPGSLTARMVTGDFNGDGRADLVLPNFLSPTVSVLPGRGDGTFGAALVVSIGAYSANLAIGDFNRDGRLDLATANYLSAAYTFVGDVSILLGQGDGTFHKTSQLSAGFTAGLLVTADFDNDGWSDLAVNVNFNTVLFLLGRGDGTFATSTRITVDRFPSFLLAEDFDQDGDADLVVGQPSNSRVTLYRSLADGSVQLAGQWPLTPSTFAGVVGDFNGDGRPDLATANMDASDVSVLLTRADGMFHDPLRVGVVAGPVSVVEGDFNGDGRPDLATVNPFRSEVAVRLGLKNGLFHAPVRFVVGGTPHALAVGDFNRDGRPDLAVADYLGNQVSILLGLGDGTFQSPVSFAVGRNPTALATGDFTGDGFLDLAVANYASNDLSILIGRRDGTFQTATSFAVGSAPCCLFVGDFNHDGRLDLAAGGYLSRDVSILLGQGRGTFRVAGRLALPAGPSSLAGGDFNGDGQLDLALTHPATGDVSLLLGRSDGSFLVGGRFQAGTVPVALVTGDFNRDGRLDLAAAHSNADEVAILLGRGDGSFQAAGQHAVGRYPLALVVGDFDGDGRLDLATANGLGVPVTLLTGLGNGVFEEAALLDRAIRSTPLVGDLNGDGVADVVVLSQNGKILFRAGLQGTPGMFQAPLVVNADPNQIATDLALVTLGGKLQIAALDARAESLSFYVHQAGGRFLRTPGPAIPGTLPSRLVAGDLNGDGRQDLVVATTGCEGILVYLQGVAGFGSATYQLHCGVNASDLALVDMDSQSGPDIVVTDQYSGDVRILLNGGAAPFTTVLRYRAGTGLYGLAQGEDALRLYSHEATVGLAAGRFDGDGFVDLVVINSGFNRFALLRNSQQGGLLNPESPPAFVTGPHPTALVTGLFNGDRHLDLAILNEDSGDLSIFLGDGRGGFVESVALGADGQKLRLSAGNLPTGLTVHDVTGDGALDLLVGNEFGDVLVLRGHGDGTFQTYQRLDRRIALAVADLNGDGQDDFVFGNQALDRVSVHYSQPGQEFVRDRQDGLLAPGAVATADLNQDDLPDLIVANGGGNSVLVYLGLGGGEFAASRSFFAGTNPVGITVSELDGDGNLDLVIADQGSNDVSILFGQRGPSGWTLLPGPRLHAGVGPVATVVQDINEDAIPDILVANGNSNDVYLLPGLGRGFFDDQNPVIYATGLQPVQLFVGDFDSQAGLDLVTVNAQSNDLTLFSGRSPGRSITLGGAEPVAALAEDFNYDGTSDLIVANSAGHLTLLLGGSNGLQVTNLLVLANLVNVSDIALGSMDGHSVEIYASLEGEEAAVPVTFFLDLGFLMPPDVASPERTSPDGRSSPVADLSSLASLPLEIIVTLLLAPGDPGPSPDTGPTSDLEPNSTTGLSPDVAPTAQVKSDLGLIESEEGEEEEDQELLVAEADEPTGGLARNALIMGADEIDILHSLDSPEETEEADVEVPFPSPMELFDFRTTVPFHIPWQEVVEEISRWTTGAAPSARSAHLDQQRGPTLGLDVPPFGVEPGAAGPDGDPLPTAAARFEQPGAGEDEAPALPEQPVAGPVLGNLARIPAFVIWLGAIFRGQRRPAPAQRPQPNVPRRA
ncbi:MAG: VCBS repeat-containing protein, partial [Gemmataceae bacterium]|nr:VCBS repeat-containing protein [Gemmataceae bacterium]